MTWSIERALVCAASTAAVAAQGIWDTLTRPPRMGHDVDVEDAPCPHDDCEHPYGACWQCTDGEVRCAAAASVGGEPFLCGKEQSHIGPHSNAHYRTLWLGPDGSRAAADELFAAGEDDVEPYDDDPMVSDSYLRYGEPKSSADGSAQGPADGPPGLTHSVESPGGHSLDVDWLVPAVTDILAEHHYRLSSEACDCGYKPDGGLDPYDWREHIAPILLAHLHQAEKVRKCARCDDEAAPGERVCWTCLKERDPNRFQK